jgi:hypothetical protein
MLFGPRKKQNTEDTNIQIEGKKLDIVTTTTFLGVILDSNITWKDHIAHISKKVARSVGILSIAKRILNKKSMIQLYYSFIYPYLTYCILIWGNSAATTLWPVYKLQKVAIRIIANLRRQDSSYLFCKNNSLLRLPEIYTLYSGIFMFKYKNGFLPPIYNNMFVQNMDIHNYPTRNSTKLRVPKMTTKIGDSFISKTEVHLWNKLPDHIITKTTLAPFKGSLIKHLLSAY